MLMASPVAVIVLCGKRKTGKDYVAALLVETLGREFVCPLRLSARLKAQYAKDNGLDFERLLGSSSYKDTYREAMITWSEAIRKKDSTHFCRLAIEEAEPQKVWLVVDARRKSDMNFFKSHYSVQAASPSQACEGNKGVGVLTVRIEADQEMRQTRGWVFTPGIDDAPSECGLDHYACDITISNNHHSQQLNQQLTVIIEWIKDKLELIIKD